MSRILPLQPDAIAQLQSSKHIVTLQGVINSLVENSLDAASSKIDITLDFARGACTVEDNGVGIPSAEFSETGGLCKMHHTSKQAEDQMEQHGDSGTFLASLAALSLLRITSKREEHRGSAMMQMHQGKVLARKIEDSLETATSTGSPGTQIIVQDLFGNMPVRVKQRALVAGNSSADDKTWDELKRDLVGLLIAWGRPCSIRLRDVDDRRKSLHLSPQHSTISNALTEKSLKAMTKADPKFDLRDVLPVLTQAGLASHDSRSTWVPISASTLTLIVKGLFNLNPVPTKHCQFISLGIHPCGTDNVSGTLYDSINKIFHNSSFGCLEDAADVHAMDDTEKDRRKRDRRYKSDGYTQKQLHGRKGVDKWPMFVLQIRFKESQRHVKGANHVKETSLRAIVDILEVTVHQWLEAHHFRPHKRRRRRNEDQDGPSAASSPSHSLTADIPTASEANRDVAPSSIPRRPSSEAVRPTSKRRKYVDLTGKTHFLDARLASMPGRSDYFSSWSRVKSSREDFYEELWHGKKAVDTQLKETAPDRESAPAPSKRVLTVPSLEVGALSAKGPLNKIRDQTSSLQNTAHSPPLQAPTQPHISSDDFGSIDDEMLQIAADAAEKTLSSCNQPTIPDEIVEWIDPVTKQRFRVNSRTGVVLPVAQTTSNEQPSDTHPIRPESRQVAAINTSLTSNGEAVTLSRRPRSGVKPVDKQWLPGFLKEWNNPIFAPQVEEKIPVASVEGPGVDASAYLEKRCGHFGPGQNFSKVGGTGTAKMTKAGLRGATVIRQVDRKFILCKMRGDSDDRGDAMLVLVDQHAASERVILERLLSELCSPPEEHLTETSGPITKVQSQLLPKPLRFQIPDTEHQLFKSRAQHFANWGILYDCPIRREEPSSSQVRPPREEHLIIVKALPPVILERSVQLPSLIIDLLRSEIHSVPLSSKAAPPIQRTEGDNAGKQNAWLSRIGSCPRGLLEMLNSRACRSAIMFNDDLSVRQCEELLAELRQCAFPFICAHGRVSMVPLIGSSGGGLETTDSDGRNESKHFAQWLKS